MALEFCASLAVHIIAANPLQDLKLLMLYVRKLLTARNVACSRRLLVLEECGVQDLYLSDGWRWWFMSFPSPP